MKISEGGVGGFAEEGGKRWQIISLFSEVIEKVDEPWSAEVVFVLSSTVPLPPLRVFWDGEALGGSPVGRLRFWRHSRTVWSCVVTWIIGLFYLRELLAGRSFLKVENYSNCLASRHGTVRVACDVIVFIVPPQMLHFHRLSFRPFYL